MLKANYKLEEKFVGVDSNCPHLVRNLIANNVGSDAYGDPHLEGIAKKEKGITLQVLIITIIVLLVLVGVTLSITLGDNGLVNKAKEAALQMEIEQDKEVLLSAVTGAIGIDGLVDFTYLDSHLPAGFTGSNGNYTSKNGHTFTVSKYGGLVYIGSDNVIDNDGDIQPVVVDLSGKYYMDYENQDKYIEIKNNKKLVFEECEYDITIDTEKQLITTMSAGVRSFSNNSNNICLEYYLVRENDEIINIVLMENLDVENDIGFDVCWQNTRGFMYDINGIYSFVSKGSSPYAIKYEFNCDEGLVYYDFRDNSLNKNENLILQYFGINGAWFIDGKRIIISEDLKTLTIDDKTFEYKMLGANSGGPEAPAVDLNGKYYNSSQSLLDNNWSYKITNYNEINKKGEGDYTIAINGDNKTVTMSNGQTFLYDLIVEENKIVNRILFFNDDIYFTNNNGISGLPIPSGDYININATTNKIYISGDIVMMYAGRDTGLFWI